MKTPSQTPHRLLTPVTFVTNCCNGSTRGQRAITKQTMKTQRLTTAQALIRFLQNQYVERDGKEHLLLCGVWGIFGHGNVAGIGQALQQTPDLTLLPGPQ